MKDTSKTTVTRRAPARPKAMAPATRKPRQDTPAAVAEASKTAQGPSNDQIAQRAYEIYLHRGSSPGSDVDDWLEAERQLRGSGSR